MWHTLLLSTALRAQALHWQRLPDLPDPLGVAGPVVGIHEETLIIAGGANFSLPVWENPKRWNDTVYAMSLTESKPQWRVVGKLPNPLGYAACVSTPMGIVVIGGNDSSSNFAQCFCLRYEPSKSTIRVIQLPPLPEPCVYAQACFLQGTIYLTCGQRTAELASASDQVWALDTQGNEFLASQTWRPLAAFPGGPRAFHSCATLAGLDGIRMHLMGGRKQSGDKVEFLKDHWTFDPKSQAWKRLDDLPNPISAGAAVSNGSDRIWILGWDDGRLFTKTDQLKDRHPGFPRECFVFHSETGRWDRQSIPQNQLTTTALWWRDCLLLPTGEIRPRVRTPHVWKIEIDR